MKKAIDLMGDTDLVESNAIAVGDILVFPALADRLHATANTLGSHGLSVGFTSRSDNDKKTVDEWFAGTKGKTLLAMATHVTTYTPERSPTQRGINSFAAICSETQVTSVRLVRLDGDLLPTAKDGSIVGMPKLVEAVKTEFMSSRSDDMDAGLDTWPRYNYHRKDGSLSTERWTALEQVVNSPFGNGGEELLHAPHYVRKDAGSGTTRYGTYGSSSDFEERLMHRLFLADSVYEWRDVTHRREDRVFVREKAYKYFVSQGMTVLRLRPAAWNALAKRLLARHAKRVLEESAQMDAIIGKFEQAYRRELDEYKKFKVAWLRASKRLERSIK